MNKNVYFIAIFMVLSVLSCVQETHIKEVTLMVDMSSVEHPVNVGVRGDLAPLSWDRSLPMTDVNNDSIYEIKIELNTAKDQLRFKFVVEDSIFELKDRQNRSMPFIYAPETMTYRARFDNTENVIITNENDK